jgi:hypothetical protein
MTARRREADETILSAQHFHDPYDAMSDDDFDAYMRRLFDQPQGPTRSVTVRMPETDSSSMRFISRWYGM